MKKIKYITAIFLLMIALSSCGSKKGCGLTSDNIQINPEIVAQAE